MIIDLGDTKLHQQLSLSSLGEQLQELLENIGNTQFNESSEEVLDIGMHIPKISKDLSDRNRTSPFAFTGNKFEFRMPGSSASASTPVFMINTIVADILKEYADYLEKTDPTKISINILLNL